VKPTPPKPVVLPTPSVREQIEAGPKFEPSTDERGACICWTAGKGEYYDRTTGLCRDCWRAWRWSPTRERERPGEG
jgi:hypothetical protein